MQLFEYLNIYTPEHFNTGISLFQILLSRCQWMVIYLVSDWYRCHQAVIRDSSQFA